jgi:hypothetical protein
MFKDPPEWFSGLSSYVVLVFTYCKVEIPLQEVVKTGFLELIMS